jgi:hypothetical protein
MLGRMAAATRATLATFKMDLSRQEEQRRMLEEMIVPGVMASPGAVSGRWTLDRTTSESFVLLTFETAERAGPCPKPG